MQATKLTENEIAFEATVAKLRGAESAFNLRLAAFAEEAAEEIVTHERHRADLARLNSEIAKAAYRPGGPPIMGVSAILPPVPPMRHDTTEKVAGEFSTKLAAKLVTLHKGA